MAGLAGPLRALAVATLLCGAGSALWSVPVQAGPLASHRAVYDMRLGEVSEKANIAGISGRMVYEFSGDACEGYTVSFRFVTRFQDTDGGTQVTDLRTTSFEEPANGLYQFLTTTYVDQELSEETRGAAAEEDGGIAVDLSVPSKRTVDLAGDIYFPTEHLMAVIEAAKNGQSFLEADIFDGSETGDKVYATTAVIGSRLSTQDLGGDDAEAVARIGAGMPWPVTVAYFDPAQDLTGEAMPVYQLSFLLYENGISRRLVLDYGDFKIIGEMKDLVVFDANDCRR
ncbi:cell envelope integrity EipB family protein [Polymorphum gilvum]|uniref:Conserved hypothetical transmembrane protein n=1 Tax=Polymorphum gilvum (strain LMG 25793 / CGMCC 1.9160 / SL003B-26A1) TaxID=991905 RepID=F2IVY1_POLGS|nr:cell envelope integrity EipB family protein [Polymorphum gilvum]ADZ70263.1 Conserved hypothetical transmembrane protein [Polymorphum gilvum SL003B-26A1]